MNLNLLSLYKRAVTTVVDFHPSRHMSDLRIFLKGYLTKLGLSSEQAKKAESILKLSGMGVAVERSVFAVTYNGKPIGFFSRHVTSGVYISHFAAVNSNCPHVHIVNSGAIDALYAKEALK